MIKELAIALILLAMAPMVSAQCNVYNSSVNVQQNEFGVFLQDRVGCALSNLMSPGTLDTIIILFSILLVFLFFYAILSRSN